MGRIYGNMALLFLMLVCAVNLRAQSGIALNLGPSIASLDYQYRFPAGKDGLEVGLFINNRLTESPWTFDFNGLESRLQIEFLYQRQLFDWDQWDMWAGIGYRSTDYEWEHMREVGFLTVPLTLNWYIENSPYGMRFRYTNLMFDGHPYEGIPMVGFFAKW